MSKMKFCMARAGQRDANGDIFTKESLKGVLSEITSRGTIQINDAFGKHDVPVVGAKIDEEGLVVEIERSYAQVFRTVISSLQKWMSERPWAKGIALRFDRDGVWAYVVVSETDEDVMLLSLLIGRDIADMGFSLGNMLGDTCECRTVHEEPHCDIFVKPTREDLG